MCPNVSIRTVGAALLEGARTPRVASAASARSKICRVAFIYGAYMTETFCGALEAIPRGQFEAALPVGVSSSQVFRKLSFARNVSGHVMFLHQGVVEEEGDAVQVLSTPKSSRLAQFLSGNKQS